VKVEKIRELKNEELETKEAELVEEIFRSRILKETGQLDQMGKVRNLRRDLAKVKTVLRERQTARA
jgi:large subunit ribosomal protein L29